MLGTTKTRADRALEISNWSSDGRSPLAARFVDRNGDWGSSSRHSYSMKIAETEKINKKGKKEEKPIAGKGKYLKRKRGKYMQS